MDNNELLQQVITLLQEQTNTIENIIDTKINESEARINVKIENEVTNRINSLFDGYKLTHEKQWELEKRIEAIEHKLNIA